MDGKSKDKGTQKNEADAHTKDGAAQKKGVAAQKKRRAANKARAVRALMRAYGITLGMANGKRCIYADNVPQDVIEQVRTAVKQNLI